MVGQPTTSRQIPGRSWPGALKMCSGPIFSRLSARSDAFEDRLIPRDHSRRRTDSPGRDTRQEYRNKSLHLEVISRQLANRHNGKKGGAGVRRIHGNAGDRRYREFRRLCPLRHQPLLQPLLRRGRPPCRQSPHLLALHEACLGLDSLPEGKPWQAALSSKRLISLVAPLAPSVLSNQYRRLLFQRTTVADAA